MITKNLGHSLRHCFLETVFLKVWLEAAAIPALRRLDDGKANQ